MPTEINEVETTFVYQPEIAQEVLAAIEEAPTEQELIEEDNSPISREAFLRRLRRAIDDAYSWIDYAEEFGAEIENGGKVKRTKLAANVTRNRLSILTSSLNDVRYAKVAD